MPSFLVIGDVHIKTDNIQEVEIFTEKIVNLAKEKNPDIIVLLGDILHEHERIHTVPLNKAYKLIDRLRQIQKTYVIVGNHDMINQQVFLNDNHWMNGMKEWFNVIIVDTVKKIEINDELFVFCPYVFPGRFIEALDTLDEDWKNASCIFAHQEFAGCKMGAITSIEGDRWDLEYPQVISGHIHNKQNPQTNIYYTGSSLQIAFGESEDNTILYLNVSNKILEKDEISLNLSRKKILYMDVEDMDTFEIPKTDDKIKITLSGNQEQFKAFKKTKKYKNLVESNIKVVFKHTKLQIKKQKEELEENQENIERNNDDKNMDINDSNFTNVLYNIVMNKKDSYLYEAYQLVINNKEIKSEDIILL